ncbi:MAG: hypothetical protein JWO58_1497 [Chitinophagaceae bacterium]|nr:hypothetical protein [Chitinophagaceae bacterium]
MNSTQATDLLKVYPNPSAHAFNLEWLAEATATYQVYDVRGTFMETGVLDAGSGVETIGETFATGVYIVKVSTAD